MPSFLESLRRELIPIPALAVVAMTASITAQAPSAWSQISPPGGAAAASLTTLAESGRLGKLALYRDGQYLRVYSTVTGRWHEHTPSFGTTPRLFDEILLVPESDRWTALSAYRGVFETLTIDQPNTTLTCNGTIAVVRHFGTVHVFSAFTGRWHTRALPASWDAGLGSRLAAFGPNANVTGFVGYALFDALTGQWHDFTAPATDRLSVGSFSSSTGLLVLTRPDQTRYIATWSTLQPVWQTHNVNAQPPLFNLGGGGSAGADFVCAWDVAYSGATGAITPIGNTIAPSNEGLVATAKNTTTNAYSCLGMYGSAWVPLPNGSFPRYVSTAPRGVRLFAHGSQTHVFDGSTGQVSTTSCDMGNFAERGYEGLDYALAIDGQGRPHIYSVTAGHWMSLPASVLPEPTLFPTQANPSAAILLASGGVMAFSGRTGAFVPLGGANLVRYPNLMVLDASTIFVFDERTDRWLFTPRLPVVIEGVTGFLTVSNAQAVAYGPRASRLDAVQLPEPMQAAMPIDGGFVLRTQNHLLAFTGLPDDLSLHAFPEESYTTGPGQSWRHQFRLESGDVAFHAIAPRIAAPTDLSPYGVLWLDPQQIVLQELLTVAPGEHRVEMSMTVPNLPVLRGTEWTVQSLVFPAASAPWLSTPSSLRLY